MTDTFGGKIVVRRWESVVRPAPGAPEMAIMRGGMVIADKVVFSTMGAGSSMRSGSAATSGAAFDSVAVAGEGVFAAAGNNAVAGVATFDAGSAGSSCFSFSFSCCCCCCFDADDELLLLVLALPLVLALLLTLPLTVALPLELLLSFAFAFAFAFAAVLGVQGMDSIPCTGCLVCTAGVIIGTGALSASDGSSGNGGGDDGPAIAAGRRRPPVGVWVCGVVVAILLLRVVLGLTEEGEEVRLKRASMVTLRIGRTNFSAGVVLYYWGELVVGGWGNEIGVRERERERVDLDVLG